MSSLKIRVYILEQEPTEAISYIKIVIFLYSVSVLFPFVEGYSRAQIFVFLFDLSIFFFFSLWVWIIFALLLFDIVGQKKQNKKKPVWNIVISVLDVSCIVGEGNNLSTTNFTGVSVSETLQKSNNKNGCDKPRRKKMFKKKGRGGGKPAKTTN